ncbi:MULTISPECIES: regulatory protein RecX [unclassified Flavobacterium]|uniref:regulatory protein RecX n=1 Tax=unclassified Flavobacterium TaxID=196869 RepID=UPI003609CD8F
MLVPSIQNKIEYYCAYQERCHEEVISKLKSFQLTTDEIDEYLVHLIENNYLNEERFACSFVRGKHNIKKWGKIRLINELKFKNISKYNIDIALKEISSESYFATFTALAEKEWETIRETNIQKKKRKFCDFLLRKGWESQLVFDKLNELESKDK